MCVCSAVTVFARLARRCAAGPCRAGSTNARAFATAAPVTRVRWPFPSAAAAAPPSSRCPAADRRGPNLPGVLRSAGTAQKVAYLAWRTLCTTLYWKAHLNDFRLQRSSRLPPPVAQPPQVPLRRVPALPAELPTSALRLRPHVSAALPLRGQSARGAGPGGRAVGKTGAHRREEGPALPAMRGI